ncbi:MAG: GNAT family N-acetyltransferase [Lunatimonas sp.]|uniref:GNAT family N-acetyltransferase n=1 Tax=Lunatimonas sp. TaxID=2060141 RepID=UPI00263B1C43|nr:GNAT family N-acetyltransferase [Lunatimonas sp.]MCC5935782.1 GNAT family N-acetyltransferase [Lunatimonas sp.]
MYTLWNTLVESSTNGTFLHHRDFMGYHGQRFVDASLLIYLGDRPVAVFPAERDGDAVYAHRGLTYAGWILAENLPSEELKNVVAATLRHYQHLGVQMLEIRSVPDCFASFPQRNLVEVCLHSGGKITARPIHQATPLPHTITDRGKVWGRKKALAKGLSVKVSEDWSHFWQQILTPNLLRRHGVTPTHTLAEITHLRAKFTNQIRLHGVYAGEEMLGGAVVFDTKRCAHLQYTTATEVGKSLRCLDLLMGVLVEQVYGHRDYFNFGVSHIPATGKINTGLSQWKESLGAKHVFSYQVRFNCLDSWTN